MREELAAVIRTARKRRGGVLPGIIRLDRAFTAGTLVRALSSQYSVIHVASHFVFATARESSSYLLLGDGSKLTLAEFGDLRFDAMDMVVLSACNTAIGGGHSQNGREIEGLGALVRYQGANQVLATLWPVADMTTASLMHAFYRNRYRSKLAPPEALRRAQLDLLTGAIKSPATRATRALVDPDEDQTDAKSDASHPFYWAPYILMGAFAAGVTDQASAWEHAGSTPSSLHVFRKIHKRSLLCRFCRDCAIGPPHFYITPLRAVAPVRVWRAGCGLPFGHRRRTSPQRASNNCSRNQEDVMSRWSTVALAGALLSFVIAGGPTHAFAFDFQISNPASGGNLSVYFVEGNGPGGPGGSSIMSLDQAVAQGAVKVYQQRPTWSTDAAGHKIQTNGPVALENLSGQSIFLQLGGLVAGGLQDQVIARTYPAAAGPGPRFHRYALRRSVPFGGARG